MNQSINPATVGMFMYIQICYSYLFDIFFFDQNLTGLQFLGAGIIFVFSVAGAAHKRYTAVTDDQKAEKSSAVEKAPGKVDQLEKLQGTANDDDYVKRM